jgi:hypothetical protein
LTDTEGNIVKTDLDGVRGYNAEADPAEVVEEKSDNENADAAMEEKDEGEANEPERERESSDDDSADDQPLVPISGKRARGRGPGLLKVRLQRYPTQKWRRTALRMACDHGSASDGRKSGELVRRTSCPSWTKRVLVMTMMWRTLTLTTTPGRQRR